MGMVTWKKITPMAMTLLMVAVTPSMGALDIAGASSGVPAPSISAPTRRFCDRIDNSNLWKSVTPSGEEGGSNAPPEFTRWIGEGPGAEAKARIDSIVDRVTPHGANVAANLSEELVRVSLWPEDEGLLPEVSDLVSRSEPTFSVEFGIACVSRNYISGVRSELLRDLAASGSVSSTVISTDASTGLLDVIIDERSSADIDDIASKYSDVARFVNGVIDRTGRYDDTNPHLGAASIANGTVTCTSNSSVIGFRGIVAMPTAGHCTITAPTGWASGIIGYGYRFWTSPDFPLHDIGLLMPIAGQTFTNSIHVEPCCPSTRLVNGTRNAGTYETICTSGQTSHANCVYTVSTSDNSQSLYDYFGLTIDLDAAVEALTSTGACLPGDSGGVLYRQKAGGAADVEGLIVATAVVPEFGIRICYYHDPFVVQTATSTTYKVN